MSKIETSTHSFKEGYADILHKHIKSTYMTNALFSLAAAGLLGSLAFVILRLFGLFDSIYTWVTAFLFFLWWYGKTFLSRCNVYVRRLKDDLSNQLFEIVEFNSDNVYSGTISDGRNALAFDCGAAGTLFLAGGWWLPKYRKDIHWHGDGGRNMFPSRCMKIYRMPNSYLVVGVECASYKLNIIDTKLLSLLQINVDCLEECFVVKHSFEEMSKIGLEMRQHKLEIS